MMRKNMLIATITVCILTGAAMPARASSETGIRRWKFSFTERIRQESSDNVLNLYDSNPAGTSNLRFRTSLGANWTATDRLEFAIRLTNENRYYLAPKRDAKLGKNYDLNEVFFDSLYVRWKNPGRLPWTLTLGRQDMMFGEGFVILEGGPLDGSRSIYFNAARIDFALNRKNNLTFFYLDQPKTDLFLPRIHNVDQKMVEQRERGVGGYFTGSIRSIGIEGYLFRKTASASGTMPRSGLTIIGARTVIPLAKPLSLTAEGTFQTGRLGSLDRTGLGGYFHLDWKTGKSGLVPASLTLGGIHLSGDDPATPEEYEGWDPSFSRWPKWSESLIYLQSGESRPALWSNFGSLYGGAGFEFSSRARLNLQWHHLRAAEQTSPSALLSGKGKDRGNLGIVRFLYDIDKNISGHFVWEYFNPGDFYFSGASDYVWVRFELLFKF